MEVLKKFLFICLVLFFPSCIFGYYDTGPRWDYRPRQVLADKANSAGKEIQAKVISRGLGTLADSKTAPWGLLLISKEKITIEQLRPFVDYFITNLMDCIYENPIFANYYTENVKTFKNDTSSLGLQSLAFRIDFWDENVDRQLYPYVAEVRLADGMVYYYYANKITGALEEAVTEPFQYRPKKPTK